MSSIHWEIENFIFSHPFNCFVEGPSQSGKTNLIFEILKNLNNLIDKSIERIIFCYSTWQPFYDQLKSFVENIEFNEGIYNIDE